MKQLYKTNIYKPKAQETKFPLCGKGCNYKDQIEMNKKFKKKKKKHRGRPALEVFKGINYLYNFDIVWIDRLGHC